MRLILLIFAMVLLGAPATAQSPRDCPQCPEMVTIPPGTFMMGSPPGEEEREGVPQRYRGRSEPQRRVTIGYAFSMGKYEVTRGEFAAFVKATGYQPGPPCFAVGPEGTAVERDGLSWRDPGFRQTDRDPVVCVNWVDAKVYAEWLQSITGKPYRLPTEAEWEYAARAGSEQARYWGDGRDDTCHYANVADQTAANALNWPPSTDTIFSCADKFVHTAPVGRFKPNAFGLYDMLGNVWEWIGDCWNASYAKATNNPDYRRDGDCTKRVARGGGWSNPPRTIRAATRSADDIGTRNQLLGFRVARTN
ncbi:MAG: formylglycine-generating enzyme family protein [Alphaproteobacteria bacterium]|nr:formylglycine-generating enzyme family protein [Alphaproteobacteria bacterium]